jgi:hypothetical protein
MITVKVKSLDDLEACLWAIREEFDAHGEREVVIKGLKDSLTEAARHYYWIIVTEFAKHDGLSKEETHFVFKEKFLLNIYLGDPGNHPKFQELAENMRIIKQLAPEQYPPVRQFVVENVSHMDATRNNMADLITECLNLAWQRKIPIPEPERKEVTQKTKPKEKP